MRGFRKFDQTLIIKNSIYREKSKIQLFRSNDCLLREQEEDYGEKVGHGSDKAGAHGPQAESVEKNLWRPSTKENTRFINSLYTQVLNLRGIKRERERVCVCERERERERKRERERERMRERERETCSEKD